MHKIDSDGATIDNLFTEGNPSLSIPATIVSAAILNAFQEEIVKVVEDAGLTLKTSGTDTFDQLMEAIKIHMANGGTAYDQTIANNTGPADVGGAGILEFNPATVAAVFMKFRIFRRTDSADVTQVGELKLAYDQEADVWLAPQWVGEFDDAGVLFTLGTVSGGPNNGFSKLKYTSDNMAGASYSGKLTINDVKIIYQ